jgi:hypothetical protein
MAESIADALIEAAVISDSLKTFEILSVQDAKRLLADEGPRKGKDEFVLKILSIWR